MSMSIAKQQLRRSFKYRAIRRERTCLYRQVVPISRMARFDGFKEQIKLVTSGMRLATRKILTAIHQPLTHVMHYVLCSVRYFILPTLYALCTMFYVPCLGGPGRGRPPNFSIHLFNTIRKRFMLRFQ
jgi:hypothetical protein